MEHLDIHISPQRFPTKWPFSVGFTSLVKISGLRLAHSIHACCGDRVVT